ncbi:acyloxyacyl hydrolase [Halomonas piscis]|uniref:acyloxyacyl hydrolase n=1 Tax=Halomonas piscis TaxID=3031727 RepID=UPI0028A21BB2|nr:acyloxyacyl hydrolase [Halomonas piscis]
MQSAEHYWKRTGCVAGIAVSALAAGPAFSWHEPENAARWANDGWSLGVHTGRSVEESVHSGEAFLPFKWNFEDYYLTSVGLRKEMVRLWQHSRIFTELNLSWVSGDQDYGEVFLTPTITWDTFPWDSSVDTTASLGVGVSYTTQAVEIENIDQRWLASMIFELDMQPASWESWSVFTRLHHRSNAGGLFGDESSVRGSNFPSIGARYHF